MGTHAKKPNVFFLSVNNGGHLPPILTVASEMQSRGFANVYIATNDEAQSIVQNQGFHFVSAGPAPDVTYEESIVFNHQESPIRVLAALQSFWGKFNGQMFQTLEREWATTTEVDGANGENVERPDFLVCDNLTTACHDLAEYFKLPYAVISGHPIGILGLASSYHTHMAHYLPMEFTVFSRSINGMSFLERVFSPIGKLLLQVPFRSNYLLLGERNRLRGQYGMRPVDKWLATTKTEAIPSGKPLTIINHSFAVDNPADIPPYMEMVGPLLLPVSTDEIGPDLQQWLDSHETVVYCSFSTAVQFNSADAKLVLDAISLLPFRVLFSLKNHDAVLDGLMRPTNLRLEQFVPQSKVLAHPNVKAFWTHMGTSSTYEGILDGVPLLAMPFYADQNANAQHAVDRGVALKVNPATLNAEEVVNKLKELVTNPIFAARAKTVGDIIRHDGGVQRAVDLLHMVIEVGSEHLIPKENEMSFVQYYGLDELLFWVIIVYAGVYCFSRRNTAWKSPKKKLH